MKSSVEALEGNKVKLSVEVDESEFEKAVDSAFKKIASEVRIPGFRPGKAPRRVLEARLGSGYARSEALREAVPEYYVEAVKEHDVDVIAAPELDITSGEEDGPVAFDAVVEVRPQITLEGYDALQVEIARPEPSDDEVQARIDRFRGQFGELADAGRPAIDGDTVSIDVHGSLDGEPVGGLTAEDYSYEVGSGGILPEVDEQLRGAKPGDILEFTAVHPDPDQESDLDFRLLVKSVQETVLPTFDDEWVKENTQFDDVEAYRDDERQRLANLRRAQAQVELRNKVGEALAALVADEMPEALLLNEMQSQVENMAMRLQAQGVSLEQYLSVVGKDFDELREELREAAVPAVKVDLALRAIAEAEDLEVTDEDLTKEFDDVAERMGIDPDDVRARFESSGQVSAVRSDLRKQKAFDWLAERVSVVDSDGSPIDRAELEIVDTDLDELLAGTASEPVSDEPTDEPADETADENPADEAAEATAAHEATAKDDE